MLLSQIGDGLAGRLLRFDDGRARSLHELPHFWPVSLWLVAAGLSRPVLDSLLKYSINEVQMRHYEP